MASEVNASVCCASSEGDLTDGQLVEEPQAQPCPDYRTTMGLELEPATRQQQQRELGM